MGNEADALPVDWCRILEQLQHDPESVPRSDRISLLASQAESYASPTTEMLAVLDILAGDPKWEVRRQVADVISHLPDDEFSPFAARLLSCCCDSFNVIQIVCEREIDIRGTVRVEGCMIDRDRDRVPPADQWYRNSSTNKAHMEPPFSIPPTYPPVAFPPGLGNVIAALFDRPTIPETYWDGDVNPPHPGLSYYEASFLACAVCIRNQDKDSVMTPCVRHRYRRIDRTGVVDAHGPAFVRPGRFARVVSDETDGVDYKEGDDFDVC